MRDVEPEFIGPTLLNPFGLSGLVHLKPKAHPCFFDAQQAEYMHEDCYKAWITVAEHNTFATLVRLVLGTFGPVEEREARHDRVRLERPDLRFGCGMDLLPMLLQFLLTRLDDALPECFRRALPPVRFPFRTKQRLKGWKVRNPTGHRAFRNAQLPTNARHAPAVKAKAPRKSPFPRLPAAVRRSRTVIGVRRR